MYPIKFKQKAIYKDDKQKEDLVNLLNHISEKEFTGKKLFQLRQLKARLDIISEILKCFKIIEILKNLYKINKSKIRIILFKIF